jgi:hypothetical protein
MCPLKRQICLKEAVTTPPLRSSESVKALIRLYSGSIKALLRVYGSIKAL